MNLGDKIKSIGTIVVTAGVFILVVIWMVAVWKNLGAAPVYNEDGTVKLDEFARAKDILVLVFPLLTTAVGFWLGSQGTAKAEEKADKADAQKTAVLDSAEPGLLETARQNYPDAFN